MRSPKFYAKRKAQNFVSIVPKVSNCLCLRVLIYAFNDKGSAVAIRADGAATATYRLGHAIFSLFIDIPYKIYLDWHRRSTWLINDVNYSP